MTQEDLENKLIKLAERQPEVDKEFLLAESEYITAYAGILLAVQAQYSSQPSRNAHADQTIRDLPIWERYQLAKYDKDTLDYQTKVYMKVASLRQSGSYK